MFIEVLNTRLRADPALGAPRPPPTTSHGSRVLRSIHWPWGGFLAERDLPGPRNLAMLGRPLQDRGVLPSEGVQTRKPAGILGPEQDRGTGSEPWLRGSVHILE